MISRRLVLLSPVLIWPAITCAESEIREYKGDYFYNFENAVFTPEGTEERWAVEGDMSVVERRRHDGSSGWGTSTVTVLGSLSPKGQFGNLGSCSRILKVIKVVKVPPCEAESEASS